jgi:hypothetical protein
VIANSGTVDLPLDAGLVIVQNVTGSLSATAGTNTGNGTIGTLVAEVGALVGNYTLIANSASVFAVADPNGVELAPANVGTTYADAEIGFKITAGTTAFAAADSFVIAVAAGNNQWSPYTSSTPAAHMGVLYNRTVVPAGGTKKVTVVTRQAEVNKLELVWDPSIANAGGISAAAGTNVGKGTIGSLAIESSGTLTGGVDPSVPPGAYHLTAESALEFTVADPTGEILPLANVGTAYANTIGFTITQGSTLFAEGDSFVVTVTESGQTQALTALAAAGIIAR